MGIYGTSTIAADTIPLEAKAAAEAQKAALEYSENQKSVSGSDWNKIKPTEGFIYIREPLEKSYFNNLMIVLLHKPSR